MLVVNDGLLWEYFDWSIERRDRLVVPFLFSLILDFLLPVVVDREGLLLRERPSLYKNKYIRVLP